MQMWKLYQYRTVYTDFYQACDEDMQAAIDVYLEQLAEQGSRARKPLSEYLEDGILEVRPRAGKRQARLLYFFQPGKRIVIVIAVFKDQRRLNKTIIEVAKRIRDQIESGRENARGINLTH